MKTLILLSILVTMSTFELFGCCSSHSVFVFPSTPSISSNSIFLIDFAERDFKFKEKNKIENFTIFAVNQYGKKYTLKTIAINYSGTSGQILLKVDKSFRLNDKISLSVTYNQKLEADSTNIKSFISQVSRKKWTVIRKDDISNPVIIGKEINNVIIDHRGTSAPGFGIRFTLEAEDNSFKDLEFKEYDETTIPILYEVTFENQKYIVNSNRFTFSIYSGICGKNFNFESNKNYSGSVRVIDASGNYSYERDFYFIINLPKVYYR